MPRSNWSLLRPGRELVLNHQKNVTLDLPRLRFFVRRLVRSLRLGKRHFNVCIVDDREIERLNSSFLKKAWPTDVLSFAWDQGTRSKHSDGPRDEFSDFLGDIIISAETARRNAREEGHSTQNEVRWLILHGLLHLKGYDHDKDHGEMTALELSLRSKLGISGHRPRNRKPKARKSG